MSKITELNSATASDTTAAIATATPPATAVAKTAVDTTASKDLSLLSTSAPTPNTSFSWVSDSEHQQHQQQQEQHCTVPNSHVYENHRHHHHLRHHHHNHHLLPEYLQRRRRIKEDGDDDNGHRGGDKYNSSYSLSGSLLDIVVVDQSNKYDDENDDENDDNNVGNGKEHHKGQGKKKENIWRLSTFIDTSLFKVSNSLAAK